MTELDNQRARVNEMYRNAGWGKVAEAFGHEPFHVESQARTAYQEIYDTLDDHMKLGKLRNEVIGKRERRCLVSGGMLDATAISSLRENMIQLRDQALAGGDMQWAVVLSNVIHVLLITRYVFDGDPVLLDGKQTYVEVSA